MATRQTQRKSGKRWAICEESSSNHVNQEGEFGFDDGNFVSYALQIQG